MKKLVIMGVGVFLLSFAATTGALVARGGPPAATQADSTAAGDSAPAAAPADSAAAHATAAVVHPPAPAVGNPPAAAPASRKSADSASAAPAAAPADSGDRLAYRQLARIFSNMKTGDAAKVLAYMSDDEVQGVIEQLGVRQAAALLAALPKERAAGLSRRLLHAEPQSKSAT